MTGVAPLLLSQNATGGAGIATRRIHEGLREIGVNSHMLVRDGSTESDDIAGPRSRWGRLLASVRPKIDALPLRMYDPSPEFSLSWVPDRLHRRINQFDPDVIHLNWIAGGYMSPSTIAKLNGPVVWRLPDMWPMTGGCHYAGECDRFRSSCGNCPQLGSDHSLDPSRVVLSRKRKAVENVDLTVVATTSWLADRARESAVFGDCPIEIVPNGLDTDLFRPYENRIGRKLFGLPGDVPLVLFGATGPVVNPRKGADLLAKAIEAFSKGAESDAELVIFGAADPEESPDFDLPTHYTGYLGDEESLAMLYAAADVMVVPSRYEGFGQTVTEAMACGTPVVAFDATGPKDTVVHERTGYLADPYETEGLAQGIEWVLGDRGRQERLSEKARSRAVARYDYRDAARKYLDIYEEIAK